MENQAIKALLSQIQLLVEQITEEKTPILLTELRAKYNLLLDIEKHYFRQEDLLFPFLENFLEKEIPDIYHSRTEEIRNNLHYLKELLKSEGSEVRNIEEVISRLMEDIQYLIQKEEKEILPIALNHLTDENWIHISSLSQGYGYCIIVPEQEWQHSMKKLINSNKNQSQTISFSTGRIPTFIFEELMKQMPVQLSFINSDDKLIYFSPINSPIFNRTHANLGRHVSQCHPPKSLDIVNQLLNDFKERRRNSEEFWINHKGRFIYLHYQAIRDEEGVYLGTLERIQDVTRMRELKGEKRLLSSKFTQ